MDLSEVYEQIASNWERVAELKQQHIELLEHEVESLKRETISHIVKEANEISGEWNGDESGLLEDRANAAGELIELLDQASVLIAELELDQPTYRTIKIKRL